MTSQNPTELIIPLASFIHRIALYEVEGRYGEAEALRTLVTDCRPAYHIDEALIRAKVAELRRRGKRPSRLA
jgi:hypothetical protein